METTALEEADRAAAALTAAERLREAAGEQDRQDQVSEARESYRKALAEHEASLRSDPGRAEAWHSVGLTLTSLAGFLLRRGGRREALDTAQAAVLALERAIYRNPENPEAYNSQGLALRLWAGAVERDDGGKLARSLGEMALRAFEKAVELRPEAAGYRLGRAEVMVALADVQEPGAEAAAENYLLQALEEYEASLRLDSGRAAEAATGKARAYRLLGALQRQAGRREEARESFVAALRELDRAAGANCPGP